MLTSKVNYLGELRTEATHLASGTSIITDAPTDNNGKGEAFSPTDLVATALASCAITIMGITANTHNITLNITQANIQKVMTAAPRRIQEIKIDFSLPASLSEKERAILEHAALACPVAKSLHSDLVQTLSFTYA